MASDSERTWNVILVEDEEDIRRQVCEFLDGLDTGFGKLRVHQIDDLSQAMGVVKERKADLFILDVYTGEARSGGEKAGLNVLDEVQASGFVPVILYTALPESVTDRASSFVRVVGKVDGLDSLKTEIDAFFGARIPQINRALVSHLDSALRDYMWGFVQERWSEFQQFTDKPEFLRLVLQRLALIFGTKGVSELTSEVYGITEPNTEPEMVHPAEYYIKPPLADDPMLGDVRSRNNGEDTEYLVVLWPSCDMITTGGRTPKTEKVLCARALPAIDMDEVSALKEEPSKTKDDKAKQLIKNSRLTKYGNPDRFHFLPGVWDIPDLVIDFQELEHLPLEEVLNLEPLATVASPFSEAIGARFRRYVGRPGTPDLDSGEVLRQMKGRL